MLLAACYCLLGTTQVRPTHDPNINTASRLCVSLSHCCPATVIPNQVLDRILNDVVPVIRQSGLAGHAEYVTRSPFFNEHPVAIDMLVDVLTDR